MAGRYKAYPEYHDSGVKWLGNYPAHWKLWPCRSLVSNRMDKNEGAKDQNYLSLMANVGVIRYEDKGDVGNKKPDDLTKCKIVEVGDLVINSMNYAIGSYGMSPYSGVCSPVYIVLRCIDSVVHRRFALRLFENKPFQKHLATFGNGILEHRAAIGWDDIKGSYVPVPPQNEQLRILKFLDHETGKIDLLIEKQQALIALLKEKRQAVISHAVTKGLNPHATMKDSGVEWLGDVPEHWEVVKCGHYLSILSGYAFPSAGFTEKSSTSTRLLRGANVGVSKIKWNEVVYWNRCSGDHLERFSMREGDVVLGMDRPVISEGVRVARVSKRDLPCLLLQRVICLRPCPKLNADFLFLTFTTEMFHAHFLPDTTGVSVPHISPEQVAEFRIALPSKPEQLEITKYIQRSEELYSKLMDRALDQINLLLERRTALISAAVTGKIDVRDWEPACAGGTEE